MSSTSTSTSTYSVADVEAVMRKVTTDLVMIATSTGAITEDRAQDFGHDIELLARSGYLSQVDVTLLSNGLEQKAVCYQVNTEAGDLSNSRPGAVLWPRVANPKLRIVVSYTNRYDAAAREKMASKLRMSWTPNTEDLSHSTLNSTASRSYTSNGYGMQRKDFSK